MEQHQRGPTAMITVSSRYGHHRVSFRLISTHLLLHLSLAVPWRLRLLLCAICQTSEPLQLFHSECHAKLSVIISPCLANWIGTAISFYIPIWTLNMSVSIEDLKIFLDFQLAPAQKYESLLMQMRCAENFIFCLANSYLWFNACRGLIVFLMGYSLKPRIWDLWKSSQSYRFHQISLWIVEELSMNCSCFVDMIESDRVWARDSHWLSSAPFRYCRGLSWHLWACYVLVVLVVVSLVARGFPIFEFSAQLEFKENTKALSSFGTNTSFSRTWKRQRSICDLVHLVHWCTDHWPIFCIAQFAQPV